MGSMPGKEVRPKIRAVLALSLGVLIGASLQRCVSTVQAPPVHPLQSAENSSGRLLKGSEISATRAQVHGSAYDQLVQLSFRRGDWVACLPLIARLSPEECREALSLFSSWPQEERETAQQLILRRWASADPEGALRASPKLRSEFYISMIKDVAHELVTRGTEGALEIISGNGRSRSKLILADAILNDLATLIRKPQRSF